MTKLALLISILLLLTSCGTKIDTKQEKTNTTPTIEVKENNTNNEQEKNESEHISTKTPKIQKKDKEEGIDLTNEANDILNEFSESILNDETK
jgi:hypothetical protein